MQIAQVLANYTLGGADMLRRAMGKKKPEEMDRQRAIFIEGATSRQVPEQTAAAIFDLMEKFAGYGFNKSHSAAYALISYQTAWLKTHYPAYFMAAVLSADMQNTDKVVTLIDECRTLKLPLLNPDVNTSDFNFTVNDEGAIVYGLGAIKGLGEGPVGAIMGARESAGRFTSLLDFCLRVDSHSTNKRTLEALVKAGALDSFIADPDLDIVRATLLAGLGETLRAAEQCSRNESSGVDDLFGEIQPVESSHGSNGLRSAADVRPWSEQQRLNAEKETLGLYLSGHPVEEYLPEIRQFTKDRIANLKAERELQLVAGLVYSIRTMKSRRGDTIAFVILDDKSGRFEVSLFAKEYEQYRELLHKDTILAILCQVTVDDYSGGGMRGRAKEVMTLEETRQKLVKKLIIQIHESRVGEHFTRELALILEPFRLSRIQDSNVTSASEMGKATAAGPAASTVSKSSNDAIRNVDGCPIVIDYQRLDSKGCIMLGTAWNVRLTEELLQQLKVEYGKDSVTVQYK